MTAETHEIKWLPGTRLAKKTCVIAHGSEIRDGGNLESETWRE